MSASTPRSTIVNPVGSTKEEENEKKEEKEKRRVEKEIRWLARASKQETEDWRRRLEVLRASLSNRSMAPWIAICFRISSATTKKE